MIIFNHKLAYPVLFGLMWILVVILHATLLPTLLLLTIPLFLGSVKSSKGYENIWVFPLVIAESIPLNFISIQRLVSQLEIYGSFSEFLFFCICFIFLLSLEEIVIGYITRKLYPKQKKLKF